MPTAFFAASKTQSLSTDIQSVTHHSISRSIEHVCIKLKPGRMEFPPSARRQQSVGLAIGPGQEAASVEGVSCQSRMVIVTLEKWQLILPP